MLQRPRLKTFLTLFPLSDQVWGLRGGPDELWTVKLGSEETMRTFCALLPHLNGQTTWDVILDKTSSGTGATTAASKMLEDLESAGLIEDADPHDLSVGEVDQYSQQLAFFSRFTSEGGAKYQALLKAARVTVFGTGELADCTRRHLQDAGVGDVRSVGGGDPAGAANGHGAAKLDGQLAAGLDPSAEPPWPADATPNLLAYAEQEHNPAALEAVDGFSKRHHVPWILLRATDVHEGCVGPVFVPGETASYVSLEARLRSNMSHHSEYHAFDQYVHRTLGASRPVGGLRAGFDCLATILTIEAVKFLTGVLPLTLAGKFLTVNILTWETELHEVLRMPRLEMDADVPQIFPWREAPYVVTDSRRG